jgi:hypothetical protein
MKDRDRLEDKKTEIQTDTNIHIHRERKNIQTDKQIGRKRKRKIWR